MVRKALSEEHTEFRWVSYELVLGLLKWDSNRNVLWELIFRLLTIHHGKLVT